MGGNNETIVKITTKDGEVVNVDSIRIHENNGEIHFHNDDENLKCAVPVATWY